MAYLDNGKPGRLDPIAHLPSRNAARRTKAPKYQPETRCPRHPDSAFYTFTDACIDCTISTPRGGPMARG